MCGLCVRMCMRALNWRRRGRSDIAIVAGAVVAVGVVGVVGAIMAVMNAVLLDLYLCRYLPR